MVSKIHHIAIAVRNIEEAAAFYTGKLGLAVREVKALPAEGVRVAFIPIGETLIELVEPLAPDHTVAAFIEKRGEGLHHVAYQTGDIAGEIDSLSAAGVRFLGEQPREGADGLIIFMHPKSAGGVLTELVQPPTREEAR
jgi:methylmalonyl-CoA epimerase